MIFITPERYFVVKVYFALGGGYRDPGERPSPESFCGEKPSGEKPSLESLCGEKPSGKKPSNFSGGETTSPSFAACEEKPSPFWSHVEKSPQISKKPSISYNST